MPEAERKKLVAGLLAEELNLGKPGGSDLKTLAKQVNTAYLKNLSMTKKRARSILTGKTSSTSVYLEFRTAYLTLVLQLNEYMGEIHDHHRLTGLCFLHTLHFVVMEFSLWPSTLVVEKTIFLKKLKHSKCIITYF